MGLDLLPLGRAKPGFEQEWDDLMKPFYGEVEKDAKPEVYARLISISIQPYEAVGAPRVGFDKQADDWVLKQKPKGNTKPDEDFLVELHGYYVLDLLRGKCDGIPAYSNGRLYEGVDETSFRGAFLEFCTSLLDKNTISRAWTFCITPEQAVSYGHVLLERAAGPEIPKPNTKGLFRQLLKRRSDYTASVEEQREILSSAGRWYIFWGKLGHPIQAYF